MTKTNSRALQILAFFILVFLFQTTHAAVSPLSVAIAPPVQFPSEEFTITGVRASVLWGHHHNIYGLDLGLVGNITDQTFTGIGVSGVFNNTRGTTTILGLQLAGLANINTSKTTVVGVQAALGMNQNKGEASIYGLQLAAANLSDHSNIYGVQLGVYNKAQTVYGFQIGLVNVVENLHGLQIGLINFNHTGTFVVSPILNIGF
jgi:hypothetical protein